jgi:transmembrane sensor
MKPELYDMADTPLSQAADWMSALRSGEVTGERARAFDAWLNAAPEHRAAFAELQAIWDDAGEVEDDPTILALRELNGRTFNRPARVRLAFGAIAATLLVAAVGSWAFVHQPLAPGQAVSAGFEEQTLRTDAGQTTTAILRDGSTVVLDANTVLHATQTAERRLISLERGGAFFQVAKNPNRPFVVSAAGKTITALGTAFEARVNGDKLVVTLVEGKVKVEQKKRLIWRGEQSMNLTAGHRLSAPEDQHWTVQQVDAVKELGWMSGRLTFFNDTLEEAVAKVNRYSDRKIVLDPALTKEPIVGVFASGDTDRFVRGMELAGIARVARETDDTIELAPPQRAEK